MKSVYTYDSYRQFLRDYYLSQKELSSVYTYAKFAKEAGLNSPNYLKLVIDGTRNLTIANIHYFGKTLGLNFDELSYFEALVLREQSERETEKRYYGRRLAQLRTQKPSRGASVRYREFISEWYSPAIVVAINGQPLDCDLKKVAKMIGITTERLKNGISILRARNIIVEKNNKYFVDSNHLVYHDPKLSNVFQRNYIKAQLDRSMEMFEKKYLKGAKFYSHTFTLSKGDLEEYENQLNSLVESIIAKADQGDSNQVAQINLQLFTLED